MLTVAGDIGTPLWRNRLRNGIRVPVLPENSMPSDDNFALADRRRRERAYHEDFAARYKDKAELPVDLDVTPRDHAGHGMRIGASMTC